MKCFWLAHFEFDVKFYEGNAIGAGTEIYFIYFYWMASGPAAQVCP
jgi:hypothetical protein